LEILAAAFIIQIIFISSFLRKDKKNRERERDKINRVKKGRIGVHVIIIIIESKGEIIIFSRNRIRMI
jgi:hypothetical protein